MGAIKDFILRYNLGKSQDTQFTLILIAATIGMNDPPSDTVERIRGILEEYSEAYPGPVAVAMKRGEPLERSGNNDRSGITTTHQSSEQEGQVQRELHEVGTQAP